jgi:hypothetical protein
MGVSRDLPVDAAAGALTGRAVAQIIQFLAAVTTAA